MSSRALYLFCVTRPEDPYRFAPPEDVAGFDGAALLTLAVGDLIAVCCEVSLPDWTGPDAQERLQEIRWVAPRALLHEEVVSASAALAPTYPMRFGTIFSDAAALHERVGALRDELLDFFSRTDGCAEWSFKGWLDHDALGAALSEEDDDAPTSGAAYLLRKRRERDLREHMDAWIRDRADDLRALIAPFTRDVTSLATRGATREEDDRALVLKWAALVPLDDLDALTRALAPVQEELAQMGLELELIGPWPAYTFRHPS
jgi:hypothetical protein